MTTIFMILIGMIFFYLSYISIIGMRYYKKLPQEKKDWINSSKTMSVWYKNFKIWRYANIPDDGLNEEFTELNKKIKPLAIKYLIVSVAMYIILFGGYIVPLMWK